MAKTVVAIYRDRSSAERAIEDLMGVGIPQERISLIVRGRDVSPEVGEQNPSEQLDPGFKAAVGGATGAVLGGAAGAFLAGVAGFALPGLGLLGIGPLASTALAGAGIGGVAGGLTGALVNEGVTHEHAAYYSRTVEQGGTLVSVHVLDDEATRCQDILRRYGPLDVERQEDMEASEDYSEALSAAGVGSVHIGGTRTPGETFNVARSGSRAPQETVMADKEVEAQMANARNDVTGAGTPSVAAPAVAGMHESGSRPGEDGPRASKEGDVKLAAEDRRSESPRPGEETRESSHLQLDREGMAGNMTERQDVLGSEGNTR